MGSNEEKVIVSIDPSFAAAGILAKVFDCKGIFRQPDIKGFNSYCNPIYGYENIPKKCELLICAGGTLLDIKDRLPEGNKKIILCDSYYLRKDDRKEIDFLIEKHNIEVYCMADLWHFCKHEKKVFYQPFDLDYIDINKNNNPTICHSPFRKQKRKGTHYVKDVIKRLGNYYNNIEFSLLLDKDREDCLLEKSKSHFFIDQIIDPYEFAETGDIKYYGGIGQSGLEGMLLRCLTFSSGYPAKTNLPAPPVIWSYKDSIYNEIIHYLNNPVESYELRGRQYRWAKKYTSYEFIKSYL